MEFRSRGICGSFLVICAIVVGPLQAEGQSDTASVLLDTGYNQMYNLDFKSAHESFHEWERLHPDDPLGSVSDAAAYLFSEFERLEILQTEFFVKDEKFTQHRKPTPDPGLKQAFLGALAKTERLADWALSKNPRDSNALFATILELGLRADYLALVEKRYFASLGFMKKSRVMAENLLAIAPSAYDAYLAVGVENYLLSLKPAPVRWLLELGGAEADKSKGVEKLRLTATQGRYLRPLARLLLAVAALRDNDPQRAKDLLGDLAKEFPRNRLYAAELARLHSH